MSGHVRLHISPLTPDLLTKIIPVSVLPGVANVSYHIVETFPERAYGYIELPAMEADKLKKKLNGSILKGSKIKVEEARERRTRSKGKEAATDPVEEEEQETRPSRKGKKRKREEGVLLGFELPEDRKVKRGWTEPALSVKDKKAKGDKSKKDVNGPKKREKSTYTDQPECLFKTKVPRNAIESPAQPSSSKQKKRQGRKDASEIVVHEFEHTTKHSSFLRNENAKADAKPVADFDESKGWLDKEGNVVEPAKKPNTRASASAKKSAAANLEEPPNETTRMGSLSLNELDEDDEGKIGEEAEDDETSSSGSSASESTSGSNSSNAFNLSEPAGPGHPAPPSEVSPSAPHPLETIFKRPKAAKSISTPHKTPLEVTPIPFSFFGADDSDHHNKDTPVSSSNTASKSKRSSRPPNLSIPQTPFTARDQLWRAQRSAAPTPDTAAPNRSGFGNVLGWHGGREDDIDEDSGEEENKNTERHNLIQTTEASDDDAASDYKHDDDRDSDSDDSNSKDDDDDDKDDENDEANDRDAADGSRDTPSAAPKSKGKPPGGADAADAAAEGKAPESEFAAWFWEHRGENNRAWKRRRREAAKEQRQKENKRRAGKEL